MQAAVELSLPDTRKLEGILLDLSETGMDVLTAEPQVPGALLNFRFRVADGCLEMKAHGQVAWAKPNGQTGVHFLELEESIKAATEGLVTGSGIRTAARVRRKRFLTASLRI